MSSNTGHRLGEIVDEGEENTIERLHAHWNLQFTDLDFRYWEFDVNELGDGTLVVFHDRDFKYQGSKYKLKDINFMQFRAAIPYAPTFFEVMRKFSGNYKYMRNHHGGKWGVEDIKPIRIEIKRLLTNMGRDALLRTADKFMEVTRNELDVQFIAFKSHFKKSFPKGVKTVYAEKFDFYDFAVLNVKQKTKAKMHHRDLFTGKSIYGDESIGGRFC